MTKAKKKPNEDSGLRGTSSGQLYIDKEVFFKREDVRGVINTLKNSKNLTRHIKKLRKPK